MKWMKRIFWIMLIWFSAHMIYLMVDGMPDTKDKADVAIVLGNRVYSDGSLSSWLQGRVDVALGLYRNGQVQKIFVSGGIPDEPSAYAEGTAMKRYLVKNGVPDTAVIIDDHGDNSYLTAKHFVEWNQNKGYTSAIVVSQFFHITRCKMILHKLGFANVKSASSNVYHWKDALSATREFFAFYKYLVAY